MIAPILEYFVVAGGRGLVLFAVLAAVYLAVWKRREKKGGRLLTLSAVLPGLLLLLYVAFVAAILVLPDIQWTFSLEKGLHIWVVNPPGYSLNLTPFKTLREQFAMLAANGLLCFDGLKMVLNLAANLFIFMPLPLLLRWNFKKIRLWQSLLIVFGSSLLAEIVQYPLHRSSDVDDLLVNTFGGLFGCVLCAIVVHAVQKWRIKKKAASKQVAE